MRVVGQQWWMADWAPCPPSVTAISGAAMGRRSSV